MNLPETITVSEITEQIQSNTTASGNNYHPNIKVGNAIDALTAAINQISELPCIRSSSVHNTYWSGPLRGLEVSLLSARPPETVMQFLAHVTGILLLILRRQQHVLTNDEIKLLHAVEQALGTISFAATWRE